MSRSIIIQPELLKTGETIWGHDIEDENYLIQPVLCRAPAYPYRRLIEDDIRLLNILPGHGTLECTLHQMPMLGGRPLKERTLFLALSYVWGDESNHGEIVLDGEPFKVTRNLHEALWQLRERPGSPETIGYPDDYFWIDAICLNQSDNVEKAKQVPRMMEIYQAALSVIVWLGPINPITKSEKLGRKPILAPADPVDLLERGHTSADGAIGLLFEKAASLFSDWDLPDEKEEEEPVLRDVFGESYGAVIKVVAELMHRPWWSRVWTFQECGLGLVPQVFAGRHAVYLEDLVKMVQVLSGHNRLLTLTSGLSRIHSITVMKDRYHKKVSSELRGQKVEMSVAECLFEVLTCVTGAQATNPRDRLYGLIGFVTYLSEKELPDELTPDYDLPFEAVYWQYATYLLQHSGDLRLLSTRRHELQGVPSWVPDFRDLGLRGRMVCKPAVRISSDKQILYLQGTRMKPICDMVGEWIDPRNFRSGIQPDLHHRIRYVEGRIFKPASQIRGITLQEVMDEFLRRVSHLFSRGGVDGTRKAYTALKGMSGPNGAWVPRQTRTKTSDAFGKNFTIADEMRRLLVLLDDGTILAVERTRAEIMPGDIVCIFKGALKPTIIRPSERVDNFVLMSHCEIGSGTFCHQLFDDEFWDSRELEEFQLV